MPNISGMPQKSRFQVPEVTSLAAQLASQIVEHLRSTNCQIGDHLTEQDFATAFRVSRTPVREAFRILESMSVVEKRPNRGYFLLREAGALESQELQTAGEEEDAVYTQIVEDRVAGNVPDRFTENQFIRRYGISRSHLIKLLVKMQHEGWVERLPGHGWEFQPALSSPEVYDQAYRFRLLIEPSALLQPGYSLEPETIALLRDQQQAMLDGGILSYSRSKTFATCVNYHETIVAGAKNPFFNEALKRINRLRSLMEYRIPVDRIQHCKEHLELLDLIEEGDFAQASQFLYRHIEQARVHKTRIVMMPRVASRAS
jgi:DNA-binding GntR family transcriptional regulator